MIAGGADVLVQVHGLLKGFCQKPPVLDEDCEVQEVNRLRGSGEIPLQQSKVVGVFDELVEVEAFGVANPNSKDIVNESAVKEEMVPKLRHESGALVHAEINGGPHAGSRGPHGRAKKLEESQVPPFKYVVPHNNGHGFLDGFQREVMWQFPFSVEFVQPLSNNFNG